MSFSIQRLSSDQWEIYRTLRLAAVQTDPQAFRHSFATLELWQDEEWKVKINAASLFFCAFQKDLPVGIIHCICSEGVWKIILLYVSPSQRGNGIAKRLLTTAIKQMNSDVELTVNCKQTAAISLYQNMRFEIVEKRKEQLMGDGNSYDKLVMKRKIN